MRPYHALTSSNLCDLGGAFALQTQVTASHDQHATAAWPEEVAVQVVLPDRVTRDVIFVVSARGWKELGAGIRRAVVFHAYGDLAQQLIIAGVRRMGLSLRDVNDCARLARTTEDCRGVLASFLGERFLRRVLTLSGGRPDFYEDVLRELGT